MGKRVKFNHVKSYKVIAFQSFNEIQEAIETAKTTDGKYPQFEVTIRGSKTTTIFIPEGNVAEVVEILKLSSIDECDQD